MSTPAKAPASASAPGSTTAPEPAKMAKKTKKGGTQDCALLYADGADLRIIGGQKIGYNSRHRVQFCWSHPPNKRPFVGIKLWFPRATNTGIGFFNEDGQPSSVLTIDIKLHVGTWESTADEVPDHMLAALPARESGNAKKMGLLRFTLNDGEKPSVDGLGLPFVARDTEDDEIVNHGAPVEGIKTLREICAQREFMLLFAGTILLPRGRDQFIKDFPETVRTVFPYSIGYAIMLSVFINVPVF